MLKYQLLFVVINSQNNFCERKELESQCLLRQTKEFRQTCQCHTDDGANVWSYISLNVEETEAKLPPDQKK